MRYNQIVKRQGAKACAIQSGITLVELLMVVAVIGMLASLLIPAVRSSRESSRQTSCLNKARQLGQAVHLYHDAANQLPPSRIADRFLTWAGLILPYLEQNQVSADSMLSLTAQPESLRITSLPIFLCPSRAASTKKIVSSPEGISGVRGDYVALSSTFLLEGAGGVFFDGPLVYGDAISENGVDLSVEDDEGVHRLKLWKSRTSFADLTDGLSQTFLIAESSLWASTRACLYDGDAQPGGILGDKEYPKEHVERAAGKFEEYPIARFDGDGICWVGSAHAEVVYVTMADGSGRPVNKGADIRVLERLVTRAGREIAPLEALDAGR